MVLGILNTKDYHRFQLCGKDFEGASKANRGLPGDTMTDCCTLISRADHKNIVGVLEIASKTRYGFTARNFPIYLFTPWNEAYPQFYVGSSYKETSTNVLAVIDYESWESNCPRGICQQIIGPCGDLISEEKALLIHLSPKKWKNLPILDNPTPPTQGGHKLDKATFHIDPLGCKDIDDAITMWFKPDKSLEVRIHIADVASTLNTNPWLWEASKQAQTIYKDGAVVAGMFPSSVEEKLSLLPGRIRMTLTLGFTYINNTITNLLWYQQEIDVKESYTYDTFIKSHQYIYLKKVISFLAKRDVTDPHELVAELMLFYNKEAAKILHSNGAGILRRHSAPDLERLKIFEEICGVPTYLAYNSGEYCKVSSTDTKHWGLSASAYCHATSPIRRWADCVNQAALINILFQQFIELPLPDIDHLNAMSKRIKRYERDLLFLRVLMGNTTKSVNGIVIETAPKLRVWIEDWNQIISIKGEYNFASGDLVLVTIFFNVSQRNWKRKMVLRPLKIES